MNLNIRTSLPHCPILCISARVLFRQCIVDTIVQRAQHRELHLPGDRLHDAIGGKFRSDDRVYTRRQWIGRWIGREIPPFRRYFDATTPASAAATSTARRKCAHDEARSQEPIIRTAQ